jgi:phage tail-like protein
MANRNHPYSSFNFVVTFDGTELFGGFSDASGIVTEMKVAEYRAGNDRENHVRKIPGVHTVTDVTLKRGIVNSTDLWTWLENVRINGPSAKREVVVTMRDENGHDVQSWWLHRVMPLKYTGPTFAAKGGTDVAMEELVLSIEGMTFQAAA